MKFIRLNKKNVGLARQASPFIRCFWSRLINLTSEDTDVVVSVYRLALCVVYIFYFLVSCLGQDVFGT